MNNGKICISICAETADEFLEKIERAAEIADIIELRFDCLETFSLISDRLVIEKIKNLKSKLSKPFIVTFRPLEEGGFRKLNFYHDRIPFWESRQLDVADYVDCEWELASNLTYEWKFYDTVLKSKIICSFHRFEGSIKNYQNYLKIYDGISSLRIQGMFETRQRRKIDIAKIAVQANDATDGLGLMKLLEHAKAENQDLIPIAMGEHGIWTRILGLSRGAFLTFASLDDASATAPGQITINEMIDVYRVKELNEQTEVYGLIAGSTGHSVSPDMHNAAFKFHNLNAVFVPFAVKNLEEFLRRMVKPETREIDLNLRGFAVTLPHKIEIIKYLDEIDDTAQAIGAVNTVKIENGKLRGFNTDAAGFLEPLQNSYGDVRGANVAVVGAGGAARACVYALTNAGAKVTVLARNLEKGQSLRQDFGVDLQEFPIQNPKSKIQNWDILVNATPMGMRKGDLKNETPATAEQLAGVGLVYDLIYNPFQTKLMREADSVFVPTLGGLAMLVAQGMIQQKIWTGKDAPMKEMSAAALRKLQN